MLLIRDDLTSEQLRRLAGVPVRLARAELTPAEAQTLVDGLARSRRPVRRASRLMGAAQLNRVWKPAIQPSSANFPASVDG